MFRRFLFALLVMAWLTVVVCGMAVVWSYNHRPGTAADPPKSWPAESHLPRTDGYLLVMLAHPKCPCTRATVEELSQLMTHEQGRLTTVVLFVKPKGAPENWNQTDLWHTASLIPGVKVLNDEDGLEANLFDAKVSGQAMLYDRNGTLKFQGGITESRGQVGANTGLSAIEQIVNTGSSDTEQTVVFGCPLFDADECRTPNHATNNR